MKRSKLCFGVLSALAIIFGLSLSVSLDTNALKYAYDAIPLYSNVFYFQTSGSVFNSYPGFSISLTTESGNNLEFNSKLLDKSLASFDTCNDTDPVNSHQNIWRSGYNSSNASYLNTGNYFTKLKYPSTSLCIGGSNDAFPSSRWSYDHIYTAKYDMSNGDVIDILDIPRFLFPDGQDGYSSSSIINLAIPLTLDSDTFDVVPSGTLMEWDIGLLQRSDGLTVDPDVLPTLDISYFTVNPSTSSESNLKASWRSSTANPSTVSPKPVCTTDFDYRFTVESPEMRENLSGVKFHCSYTAPSDLYYVSPRLRVNNSDGHSSFLTWQRGDLFFSGSYFTTDGDTTWSGQLANEPVTGDDLDGNPSYNQFYGYDNTCPPDNFFCQLENLFSFNFINPFEPIFQLFTDSNQCVSIPTIAGMIHSEETTVCPWFPSSVRNIATPVIGISSMMLIFGFAVRWLGASSGNFFEDTRHEEVSNQGGRWGHFKKGGF